MCSVKFTAYILERSILASGVESTGARDLQIYFWIFLHKIHQKKGGMITEIRNKFIFFCDRIEFVVFIINLYITDYKVTEINKHGN